MKKIVATLALLAAAHVGTQAAIFKDSFNYPDGGIVSNSVGVWVANSGNAGTCLVSNNTLQIWNNNGTRTEDIAHPFVPGLTNGPGGVDNVYARFTLKATGDSLPTAAGTYFFSFASDTLSHFSSRTFALATNLLTGALAPAGSFYLAVENGSANPPPTAGQPQFLLTTNVSYTVVVRQALTNGISTIWVGTDPTTMSEAGSVHATPDDSPFFGTSNIIQWVNFRQAAGEGTLLINDLKVGQTWNDVFFAPEISALVDQNIPANASTPVLNFTVDSPITTADKLTVTAASSNPSLVPNDAAHIVLGSDASGTNRTVQVTPLAGQQGSATITLTVSYQGASSSSLFKVNVGTPSISAIANQSFVLGASIPPILFTASDPEGDALQFYATSSNTNLLKASNISFGRSGSSSNLTVVPEVGKVGVSTVTVLVTDSHTTNSTSFRFSVGAQLGVIFNEPFPYADGQALYGADNSQWTHVSPTGDKFQEIGVTNNMAYLSYTNQEDVGAALSGGPYYGSNAVVFYTSFTVNFSALPSAAGGYFLHLKASQNDTSSFNGKVFANTAGAASGKFRIGVANSATSVVAQYPRDLSLKTTYIVVMRYNSGTGEAAVWVNPASENSTKAVATDSPGTATIGGIALREDTGIGNLAVGPILVSGSFSDVLTVTPPTPDTLHITVSGGNAVLTWANSLFSLQSAPAPSGPWTTIDGAASGYSATVGSTPQFFRLIW